MARAEEDGVKVLVVFEVVLVEGEFAIGRLGLAEAADRFEAIGAEVGQDVFDAPESVGAGFDLEADFGARF